MDEGLSISAPVTNADNMAHARRLIETYLDELGIDLCFQGVAEELERLPGEYAEPDGALLFAYVSGVARPVGMVAYRKMSDGVCEMKRLYVEEEHRVGGAGRALCIALMEMAGAAGYHTMKLDTLKRLTAAVRLYEALGFVPTERYNDNPYDDIVYLQKAL